MVKMIMILKNVYLFGDNISYFITKLKFYSSDYAHKNDKPTLKSCFIFHSFNIVVTDVRMDKQGVCVKYLPVCL